MKIKNINVSVFVLVGLILLSFAFFSAAEERQNTNNIFLDSDQDGLTNEEEKIYGTDPQNRDTDNDGYSDGAEIKSGYDPKKPAPGDKVFSAESALIGEVLGEETKANLTEEVTEKILEITTSADTEEDEEITLDKLESILDETLNTNLENNKIVLPEIKEEDLNIKEQNYSKLSEEAAFKKRREDFAQYISAVFYIFSSNSPKPLTSSQDIVSISAEITEDIIKALNTRDTSLLSELNASGEKIIEQLKEVEVPEELVETHIKALQFAYYAQELEKYIETDSSDPLANIANFSKIQGFLTSVMAFSEETEKKFAEYDLSFDEDLKTQMEDYGIEINDEQQIETGD